MKMQCDLPRLPIPGNPPTCAVSQKCEQERSPGHGVDAPVLCFSRPATESACAALIITPTACGGGAAMQMSSSPGSTQQCGQVTATELFHISDPV